MCNYAVNSLTFSSRDTRLLKGLYRRIWACYRSRHHNSVRELLHGHHYPASVLDKLTNRTDHFSHCDKFITKKGPVSYFTCETTTAWSGNLRPFFSLLADRYEDNIHLSFISEEPGSEEYVVKDETGMFYKDRYRADWCYDGQYGTEYFPTYPQLVDYLQKAFPEAILSYYDTIEDLLTQINVLYKDRDTDYYLTINRYKEYDPALNLYAETEVA